VCVVCDVCVCIDCRAIETIDQLLTKIVQYTEDVQVPLLGEGRGGGHRRCPGIIIGRGGEGRGLLICHPLRLQSLPWLVM
jgi:hypothetical protein